MIDPIHRLGRAHVARTEFASDASAGWLRVTAANPCPVCGRPDWCGYTADGEIARCMRAQVGGRAHPQGGRIVPLTPRDVDRPRPRPRVTMSIKSPLDYTAKVLSGVAMTSAGDRELFARQLGLEFGGAVQALADLQAFRMRREHAWCFPMRDARGVVIGLRTRGDAGAKRATPGSLAGLFFCLQRLASTLPVLMPEGPTSTMAALTLGLPAVGRSSASMGVAETREAQRLLRGRDVVVMAENDAKPDGRWPGREGAERAAQALLLYARSVRVAFPPPGHKDLREWVRAGASAPEIMQMTESAAPLMVAIGGSA